MDFYLPYINKNASEVKAVRFGRIMGATVMIIGIICSAMLLSHSNKPIFIYLMNAYGYVTPGITAMFLLGILWKRTTAAGAITAGMLTIPLSVAVEKLAPLLGADLAKYITPFANRTGIVFWICMAAAALVSLKTKPKSEEELKGLIWNKESLKLPEEMRKKMRGFRSPVIWWAIITLVVLYMYIRYH
jgi:SSS family solute:Na+ symporter